MYASPYEAMGNNPAFLTDPDGKCPMCIVVGAFVGAVIGGVTADMQGKNVWAGILKGAALGALGGVAGEFAPIGFLPGAAYGAATGAILGGLGSALNGGNIWNGALIGGISGGIIGGISGGLEASQLGANFWTGYRGPLEIPYNGIYLSDFKEDEMPYNDQTLNHFKNANFPNVKGAGNMTMQWRPTKYTNDGTYFISPKGEKVLAVTLPRVWKNGNSGSIFFSKAAFYSPETMFLVMGHELGHVQQILLGVINDKEFSEAEQHLPIYQWTQAAAAANKWDKFLIDFQRAFNDELGFTQPDNFLKVIDKIPLIMVSRY